MAAKHGMAEDAYKTCKIGLKVSQISEAQETCPECGKPKLQKLPSKEKQKGDGKVC